MNEEVEEGLSTDDTPDVRAKGLKAENVALKRRLDR